MLQNTKGQLLVKWWAEPTLELLSTLVEIYEDEHFPIEMPDPETVRQFRMEQMGLKR